MVMKHSRKLYKHFEANVESLQPLVDTVKKRDFCHDGATQKTTDDGFDSPGSNGDILVTSKL